MVITTSVPLKNLFHRSLGLLPDALYLQMRYRQRLGRWPDLRSPRRFSEKLQWLKLHERKPEMTLLADKLAFKKFVSQTLGAHYVIPVLKAGKDYSEFHSDTVPNAPFVLKTSHDSGSTMVIPDPSGLDIAHVRRWLKTRLSRNFYLANREWEYKNISPMWFTEPLLQDETAHTRLNDFKVHCFHGRPRFVQTIFDRGDSVKENWFDLDWQPLDIEYFSKLKATVTAPACLPEMGELATKLSSGFAYVRIDFYIRDNRPLLGEMTFRPYGGFMKWSPDSADFMLGDLLNVE